MNLMSGKQDNRRIYNWCLKLTEYDFEMVYREGKQNVVADDLSRCFEELGSCDSVTHLLEEGEDVGSQEGKPTCVQRGSPQESKQKQAQPC